MNGPRPESVPGLPERVVGRARVVLALALVVLTASVSAASCRAFVAGEGVDGAEELCDLLRRCFGASACDSLALRNRFTLADEASRVTFLDTMNANQCLSSCSAAKACWDSVPVCRSGVASCTAKEECCQFTTGKTSCDEDAAQCCIPRSVPCTPYDDANPSAYTPCCGGRACTKINSDVFTCGGDAPCVELDQPCDSDAACCSNQCEKADGEAQGVCVPKTCGDINVGCGKKTDCCDDLCCAGVDGCPLTGAGEKGVCLRPLCQPGEEPGNPCVDPAQCDPDSPDPQCCGLSEFKCVRPLASDAFGICTRIPAVLPPGFDCSSDAGCCPIEGLDQGVCGVSGVCQVSQSSCTEYDPAAYKLGAMDNCGGNLPECCGGCFGNKCACGLSTCHAPTLAGPPLGCPPPVDPANLTPDEKLRATWEACALEVCQTDPACCCLGWESACVVQALEVCTAGNLQ